MSKPKLSALDGGGPRLPEETTVFIEIFKQKIVLVVQLYNNKAC